jgi:hypothetical protein
VSGSLAEAGRDWRSHRRLAVQFQPTLDEVRAVTGAGGHICYAYAPLTRCPCTMRSPGGMVYRSSSTRAQTRVFSLAVVVIAGSR